MTRRLLVVFLTLTVVVLLVLEVPLAISYQRRQVDQLTTDVERDAVVVASFAEDTLEGTADADLQGIAEGYADRTDGRVVIVDAEGTALADSDPLREGERSFASRPEVAEALEGRVATGTRRSDSLGTDLVYVAVPVASGGVVHGAVRITYPASEVAQHVREYWLRLGLAGLATILVATSVGVLLARSVARPLTRLEQAAVRLGEGDLGARGPDDAGPPEVRTLARAFNDTARRLEALVGAQDAFVADASHQLRSPITALQLRLENLLAELDGRDAADVQASLHEVERLSRLIDGLLALARADRRGTTATAEVVPVRALLRERAEVWAALAADEGCTVAVQAPDGLAVEATPDRLASALDNLIANAVDASPDGGAVTLRASRTDDQVELHVEDEGPGMDAEARRRALDRFWRANEAAGSRLGGSGLGLPIADKLVRADGGTLELRSGRAGLDAVVSLPRADAVGGAAPRRSGRG